MTGFAYRLDPPDRPRLGLIVLQADETIEGEFPALVEGRAAVHVSRVPSGREVTRDTLSAMAGALPAAAGVFPDGARFDCIGYACTSGASVIGSARVAELVGAVADTRAVTDPVRALVAACDALAVRRLALLSPYVAEVSDGLRAVLADSGIETPVFGSFNVAEEAKVARIDAASLVSAACALAQDSRVETVVLSCTNLRTRDIVAEIEDRCGKPVLTSTQALAWHMARLAGLPALASRYGRIMASE